MVEEISWSKQNELKNETITVSVTTIANRCSKRVMTISYE